MDAFANGAILSKTFNEAYEMLQRITSNNCQRADVVKTAQQYILDLEQKRIEGRKCKNIS